MDEGRKAQGARYKVKKLNFFLVPLALSRMPLLLLASGY